MTDTPKLGFSGALAKRFQDSKITPLLALTGLLLGLFAVAGDAARGRAADQRHVCERIRAVPGRERPPRSRASSRFRWSKSSPRSKASSTRIRSRAPASPCSRSSSRSARTAPPRSCGSTTPSIRTATGSRPAAASAAARTSRWASTTCPIVTATLWTEDRAARLLRDAARRACARGRDQARSRHARRLHDRRPRQRRARQARSAASGRLLASPSKPCAARSAPATS